MMTIERAAELVSQLRQLRSNDGMDAIDLFCHFVDVLEPIPDTQEFAMMCGYGVAVNVRKVYRAIRPVTGQEDAEGACVGNTAVWNGVKVQVMWYNQYLNKFGKWDDCRDSGSDSEFDYPSLWWVEVA